MPVHIIRHGKSRRLARLKKSRHRPSGRGRGKWHNQKTYWAYLMKRRRKNHISAASRRRNRASR